MRKNNKYHSLATRLSLWIIPLGAIIFTAILGTNYFLSRLLLEDYVEDLAKTKAVSTVKNIETIFDTVANNADSLATVISSSNVSEQQIHQTIKAFLNTNTDIFGMTVALEPHILFNHLNNFSPYYYKKDDTIAFSDLANKDYQYKNWPWYTQPKKTNTSVWSEPYLDEGGGNVLMTTYSTPIYVNNNIFAGVATADIQLSWLDEIVRNIKVGQSGFGFIVSRDDIVIAHPNKKIDLKPLDKNEIKPEAWDKYITSKKHSSAVYFRAPCYDNTEYCWLAINTLGNTGWKVVIVLPERELTTEINSLTIKIAIIAVIGLFILLFVVVFITRHITHPLEKLAKATQDIGAGNLDIELPATKHKDEVGALTDDFNNMRSALKSYISEIRKTTAKQQKLESEIQIAKDIQMSMIPGAGHASIKQENLQLYALLRPARSVGGDLYYFEQSDEILHFIIGDVSDKGVPAALFMAKTVTLYTRALKDRLSPGDTFTMMNDILAKNNDACMFVTALCGSLNLSDGSVVMANAGHMNPVIKNPSNTNDVDIGGATALGLMEGIEYSDVPFQLNGNTSLIMYTDGITEAHDKEGNQYSDERLIDLVSALDINDAVSIGNSIISEVDNYAADTEQFDDITLLIIRYEKMP